MYEFVAYPLDVIKTNRIVNSNLAKEGVESLPRELTALYSRGGLSLGLFRGFAVGTAGYFAYKTSYEMSPSKSLFVLAPLFTAVQQPFNVMLVHKQVVQSRAAADSYASIFAKVNAKLILVGAVPTLFRNLVMVTACQPSAYGIADNTANAVLALGAITLSHPFEVARVYQQYHGDMNLDFRGTLNNLYSKGGFAGMYRGLVPRTIHVFPWLVGLMAMQA